MRAAARFLLVVAIAGTLSCNNDSPSTPTPLPPPPLPNFQITTLITVYPSAEADALFSRGTTTNEQVGQTLLGVTDLGTVVGSTNFNNEEGRVRLQEAIGRAGARFTDADYQSAFGETRPNLDRFLNDADSDSWSIDGRHGPGRDWPYDSNGNDPDGFTAQIVVTVTRLR